jgi:hypothetical protein
VALLTFEPRDDVNDLARGLGDDAHVVSAPAAARAADAQPIWLAIAASPIAVRKVRRCMVGILPGVESVNRASTHSTTGSTTGRQADRSASV